MKTTPRLQLVARVRPRIFKRGITWWCKGGGAWGSGSTPSAAYGRWSNAKIAA
jgi:hypothetical protein